MIMYLMGVVVDVYKKFKVYRADTLEDAQKIAFDLIGKDAEVVYINSVKILRELDEPYYIVSANENNVVVSDDRVVELVGRIERGF